MVGFGAILPRVLDGVEPQWVAGFISVLFVVSGSVVLFFGVRNYREMTLKLEEEQVGLSWLFVAILAGALQLGALLILILFLFG